ncbi:ISAs1 family transposase, partial [Mesorhizobium sp. M1312]|uniref:ISAs1 family transposase n=1 Tax=unclassified Mesorhizobium TaxID=325217 RepID=UPI00333D3798
TAISCLESYFGALPDPRAPNATHRLGDLIVMMIAASLCGASNATEFALFAQERKQALSRLIDYDAAPSHDTFSRLLRLLDPEAFGRAFAAFAAAFARAGQEGTEVVSLDGKALRRAYEKGLAASPPLTVSAFAAETRLCLAAVSPSDGENEVEAALKVIEPSYRQIDHRRRAPLPHPHGCGHHPKGWRLPACAEGKPPSLAAPR